MTFELRTVNLASDRPLPLTAVYPAGQVTRAFSLTPTKPAARWRLQHTNYFKLGAARHSTTTRQSTTCRTLRVTNSRSPRPTTASSATREQAGMPSIGKCRKAPPFALPAAGWWLGAKSTPTAGRHHQLRQVQQLPDDPARRRHAGSLLPFAEGQCEGEGRAASRDREVIARSGNTDFPAGRTSISRSSSPERTRAREPADPLPNDDAGSHLLLTGETYAAPAQPWPWTGQPKKRAMPPPWAPALVLRWARLTNGLLYAFSGIS